jgi:hypothetical protein
MISECIGERRLSVGRLWSVVNGQGRGPVLMRLMRRSKWRVFLTDLRDATRFGTEPADDAARDGPVAG